MTTAFAVTTIQADAPSLVENLRVWPAIGPAYIALDRRTEGAQANLTSVSWLSFSDPPRSRYETVAWWDTYARKNIAFIEAAKTSVDAIFETDDDNLLFVRPQEIAEDARHFAEEMATVDTHGVVNLFPDIYPGADGKIWPRGLPLSAIDDRALKGDGGPTMRTGVIQYLVEGNPDVDAIYRLVMGAQIDIRPTAEALPVAIGHAWHPFNSQATLWPRRNFLLLYLPTMCDFRMTDIWRGYVAQRILREVGETITFLRPIVRQERNQHNIAADFFGEHDGYLQSPTVIETLDALDLGRLSVTGMLGACYEVLIAQGVIGKRELVLLDAWCEDMG